MKENILKVLKDYGRALSLEEIDSALDLKTVEETEALCKTIKEMEENVEIYHSNKNKYMLFSNSNVRKGTLSTIKSGSGFVKVGDTEEDVFVDRDNINNALNGDVVLVEIIHTRPNENPEGRILRIVERKESTIIGEYFSKRGKGFVDPDDKKLNITIEIPKDKNMGAVDGHKVVVEITSNQGKGKYKGRISKIIGHKNDPGVDILSIIYDHNIKTEFDAEVQEELLSIPQEVSEKEKIGRRDLTNEQIFTIDGDDTKDIDDAIGIRRLENGNIELGVHIADVSYYVKEGSALDKEAMERGTSVYLVDRVIPMIPHQLSNGICSLNPNVERLAVSCVMEINDKGKVVNYELFESVIKSNIQMTYKNVNKILEENIIPEGYEQYVDALRLMEELANILRDEKEERGFLDFNVDEAKILVDETCHPIEIVLRDRGKGERIIEDFMIAANECVARHIFYMDLPFIYRVHEKPEEEKIKKFLSFLQTLGYSPNGNMKSTSPKAMQNLLEYLSDKKEFPILSALLSRNMQKAVYLPQNLGHYGIASKCYTHFTSPIRRYPDTTVHRLLRTYVFKNNMSSDTINHWLNKLPYIAEHASETERESIECERDVDSMKMAEYMEDHIGEEFEGMISSIMNFGMFVQLDNLIEGLVHFNNMDDYYVFDETSQTLTGEKTRKQYRLGDRIVVKVIKASKEESTIDFEIVKKV